MKQGGEGASRDPSCAGQPGFAFSFSFIAVLRGLWILVPQPRIKLMPSRGRDMQRPNHRTTREVPAVLPFLPFLWWKRGACSDTHFLHIAHLLRKFASTNVLYIRGQLQILSLLGWIYTQAKEVTVCDMMLRLCNECIAQSLVLE